MTESALDILSAGPRYLQVYAALRERLRTGVYEPGARLPNQLQLAREFGVSFMTLRRAVELLEREGYLASRHGLGTFATFQPGTRPLALVVDGDSAARAQLRSLLEGEGLRVVEAADAEEALRVAQHTPAERVFLDARAAALNGTGLAPRLRALRPGVAIIVGASGVEELALLHHQQVWPALVVPKPWRATQVREALRLTQHATSQTE
jgi:GntR family transcriptional regulator